MTSASIRYMEPNRLKYVMALRSFLKDMETLIQKKTPSENGSMDFDRYQKIFEQVIPIYVHINTILYTFLQVKKKAKF